MTVHFFDCVTDIKFLNCFLRQKVFLGVNLDIFCSTFSFSHSMCPAKTLCFKRLILLYLNVMTATTLSALLYLCK